MRLGSRVDAMRAKQTCFFLMFVVMWVIGFPWGECKREFMWAKREDNSRSRAPFPSEGSRAMGKGNVCPFCAEWLALSLSLARSLALAFRLSRSFHVFAYYHVRLNYRVYQMLWLYKCILSFPAPLTHQQCNNKCFVHKRSLMSLHTIHGDVSNFFVPWPIAICVNYICIWYEFLGIYCKHILLVSRSSYLSRLGCLGDRNFCHVADSFWGPMM